MKEKSVLLISFLEAIQGGCLLWLSWQAIPEFCTSIRETSLAICWPFLQQPQIGPRIMKAIWWAERISGEEVTQVLWSELLLPPLLFSPIFHLLLTLWLPFPVSVSNAYILPSFSFSPVQHVILSSIRYIKLNTLY